MKLVKLGEVCKLVGGGTPSKANSNFYVGEIPWATVRDLRNRWLENTEHKINSMAVRESSTNIIPSGNVVLASRVGLGKVVQLKYDTAINQDLRALIPRENSKIDPNYLYYWTLSITPEIVAAGKGATVQGVTLPFLENLEILLPILEKQGEIVKKLDSAFAEIDLSYQYTTESFNYLASCFDSFLDKILKNQILEFGLKKMAEVLEIARGGSPRPISSYLTKNKDGVNWVKISDATSSKKYITETSQKIKPEGISRSRLVNPGDFLLSNSMSFGRPYIMGTTGCIHDGWLVLSNDKKLLNQDYLYYVLGSKYIYDQFNRTAAGSTVRNLNISLAGQVTFPVPDLETQESIVAQLIEFETSIDELKKSMADKLKKLLELKNSILSNAFDLNESSEAVA